MSKELLLGKHLETFLEEHDLPRGDFDKTKLKVEELNAIADDHESKRRDLLLHANLVANVLQEVKDVHSVKSRVKGTASLVAKIIRKRIGEPERVISLSNYKSEITDLIGVRALHLFKGQWKPVSDFVRETWEQSEQPVAYYRSGDAEETVQAFSDAQLRIEVRAAGYRSIHHTIHCGHGIKKHLVEIQIRTVFEEAWSEIDHIVRYPRKTNSPELAGFLKLFSAFAGTADDMGSYLMALSDWVGKHQETMDRERRKVESLEAQVLKLKISEVERKNLQRELESLRSTPPPVPPTFISSNTSSVFGTGLGGIDSNVLNLGT